MGLVSYAVASNALERDLARLRARGSRLGDAEARSRARPDGEVVTWRASFPPAIGPAEPPFVIQHELAGAEWGAPAREARARYEHPSGAGRGSPPLRTRPGCRDHGGELRADARRRARGRGGGRRAAWARRTPGDPAADRAAARGHGRHRVAARSPEAREVDALGVRWRVLAGSWLLLVLRGGASPTGRDGQRAGRCPVDHGPGGDGVREHGRPWTNGEAIVAATDPGAGGAERTAVGGAVVVQATGRWVDVEVAVGAHDDVGVRRRKGSSCHARSSDPSRALDRRMKARRWRGRSSAIAVRRRSSKRVVLEAPPVSERGVAEPEGRWVDGAFGTCRAPRGSPLS